MECIRAKGNLTVRLAAALELLTLNDSSFESVADIGCDHGKLSLEMIRSGAAKQVIASDISSASLSKTKLLAVKHSLESKLHCIISDGFSSYSKDEIQAAVICGMGGELIAEILDTGIDISHSLKRIIMQPMRGEAELRNYLYMHNFRIISERVVFDGGRYYQLLCAEPGTPSALPHGWPSGYYQFGAAAFEAHEELFEPMLRRYLGIIERKLLNSETKPDALLFEEDSVKKILALISERNRL